jgi:DNA-directed RNA polymerase subunit RPC12/RpoP
MSESTHVEGASFYGICPNCNKPIPFQGVDIQYYKPIGYELKNELYTKQEEVMDTGETIACPYCNEVSKAKEFTFVLNNY